MATRGCKFSGAAVVDSCLTLRNAALLLGLQATEARWPAAVRGGPGACGAAAALVEQGRSHCGANDCSVPARLMRCYAVACKLDVAGTFPMPHQLHGLCYNVGLHA